MPSLPDLLAAVREWVETGIGKTLEEDASGFLLGIESVSILEALDGIKTVSEAHAAVAEAARQIDSDDDNNALLTYEGVLHMRALHMALARLAEAEKEQGA